MNDITRDTVKKVVTAELGLHPELARRIMDALDAATPEQGPAALEWSEGKKRTEGPFAGEVTKWSATSRVPDGVLYWSITHAAPERFVLRVKDDNRTDTVWLGHRPTLAETKALAERLHHVLGSSS